MELAIWVLIGVVVIGIWVISSGLDNLYTAQKYTNTLLISIGEKLPAQLDESHRKTRDLLGWIGESLPEHFAKEQQAAYRRFEYITDLLSKNLPNK